MSTFLKIKNTAFLQIFILSISILFQLVSCNKPERTVLEKTDLNNVTGIYRLLYGEREGFKIWIVDGPKVREKIFAEFLFGGNPERYIFNPEGEIWVDNSITSEELETTIAHEINERNLMYKYGMTYFDAHDSSLSIEVKMRNEFFGSAKSHESSVPMVSPTDFDSTQEIETLPELVTLKNIYRQYIGERNGLNIWIVDGVNIRRDIYPDFGFSGNDLAYHFIPANEIWIDAQISCEELPFSIELEIKERELLSKGKNYDDSYTEALDNVLHLRQEKYREAKSHSPLKITHPLFRDKGRGIQ
jgi:hypothetical protein